MSVLPLSDPGFKRDAQVISLIGMAHGLSHFSQLLLAPLFPWLKTAFDVSYTQLGFVLTIFFVVSCAAQALSGFVVDRWGPRPVLLGGLTLLCCAILGNALAPNYATLAACAVLAGLGNGVFHPVDFTVLNAKVQATRLGHAYSLHGISGSLGWALAPTLLLPVAMAYGWRVALLVAAVVAITVLAVVWIYREHLTLPEHNTAATRSPDLALTPAAAPVTHEAPLAFLRLPAVWLCFAFFLFYAAALSVVQTYAPEAAKHLHGLSVHQTAVCLSIFMMCSATGMVGGGFMVSDPSRCERIVALGFSIAAVLALSMAFLPVPAQAVPWLFGAMGAATGMAGPSRDLLVKRATPAGATGRVYGVVYAGLDIGQALTPLLFGLWMDHAEYQRIWVGLAAIQLILIANAFNVRRTPGQGSRAATST